MSKQNHTTKPWFVTMTDKFMSGWGMASGKINKLVIECETYQQAETLARNAKKRPEMRYVNIVRNKPRYPGKYVSWKVFSDFSGPWLAE